MFKAKGFLFSNPKHVTITEGTLLGTTDRALVINTWNFINAWQMPAGIAYEPGYGDDERQSDALARIYGAPVDTAAAALTGKLKFVLLDTEQNHEADGPEIGTDELLTSATIRAQKLPFPACGKIATQDKYWACYFYATSIGNGTLDVSASDLAVSFTRYKVDRV